MSDILDALLNAPGLYLGPGDGLESGQFTGRLLVTRLPGKAVSLDYEAFGAERQHVEHSVLGRSGSGLVLVVSHEESPVLAVMDYRGDGIFDAEGGPMLMSIRIALADGALTYAWSWALPGDPLTEQSRATLRRWS